jgi:SAM-dependent methyltransferase
MRTWTIGLSARLAEASSALEVPLEHAVCVEPLQPQQARRGPERPGSRDAVRLERRRKACCARCELDARGRQQPHELATTDDDSPHACLGLDPLDHEVRHCRVEIDDVRRHLDGAVGELEAQGLDAREAAPRLADRHSDPDGDLEGRLELDVEGDEGPARSDEDGAGCIVEPGWAEHGSELATVDTALQLGGPAAPVVRRPYAVCECPVEEHRQAELVAHATSDTPGHRFRTRQVVPRERHHGHDVGSADARMDADVRAEVDESTRHGDSRDEPVLQRALVSDERVDGAVVARVDMRVEEPRARRCEGRPERPDRGGIAPFRDVRDGLENDHPPTLGIVCEPTAPAYYDRRAPEYDDWYLGRGAFADRDRPGFDDELACIVDVLASLEPAQTLDVACGTGFLTRHLRGGITGLDASARMLTIASRRIPAGNFVRGDGLALPFPDDSFDRVLSGHFYGHLDGEQRLRFLHEARRVAPELVLVDASAEHSDVPHEWSERMLRDGSRWEVFKRYFDPAALLDELGGGEVLHADHWFVVVRSPR